MLFRCDRKLYISVDTNLKQSVIENRLSKDYCCTFVVLVVVTKEKKTGKRGWWWEKEESATSKSSW
jgi:phage gp46-like protein